MVFKTQLGWCAHGKKIKRWKFWENDKCPCCMTHKEKLSYHILTCNKPEMKVYRQELYDKIENWLIDQNTHQILKNMLMEAIWRKIRNPS